MCFVLNHKDKTSLPWARMPPIKPGSSEPHLAWTWTLLGMEHPQLLWKIRSSAPSPSEWMISSCPCCLFQVMATGDEVQQGNQQAHPVLHFAWHCPTWPNAEAIASFNNHSIISTHILISSTHSSKIKQLIVLAFNSHLDNCLSNGQISHLTLCHKCRWDC